MSQLKFSLKIWNNILIGGSPGPTPWLRPWLNSLYFRPAVFWQCKQALSWNYTKRKVFRIVYFLRYYNLFDFTLVRWAKWINRNFSQNWHNLKTLRLVEFRLIVLVTLPKNLWTRVLGSVVIQLYAGECTPSVAPRP